MERGRGWVEAALADLLSPDPEVLARTEQLFGATAATDQGVSGLVHNFEMVRRALRTPDPFLLPVTMTSAEFAQQRGFVAPTAVRATAEIILTPAFRNAFDDDDRAAEVIRRAIGFRHEITRFAVPGSPRHLALVTAGEAGTNGLAYAAFAHASSGAPQRVWHPLWSWAT
jgi:hypothetical protein